MYFGALEDRAHAGHCALDGPHRVADDEGADARAADDHQLERLVQDAELAAHRHIAAEHAAGHHHNADYDKHRASPDWLTGTGMAQCRRSPRSAYC